jgi:hypothetical protein
LQWLAHQPLAARSAGTEAPAQCLTDVRASLLLVLAACEQVQPAPRPTPQVAPRPHELVATLERTTCYGTCPAYRLAVYRDGVVQYTGEHYVEVQGAAIGHLSQGQLAALDQLFADTRYFDLQDKYMSYDITDLATAVTSYQVGARAKQVDHYHGDASAPPALEQLEAGIDRIVGTERWIGTPDQREAHARDWY